MQWMSIKLQLNAQDEQCPIVRILFRQKGWADFVTGTVRAKFVLTKRSQSLPGCIVETKKG